MVEILLGFYYACCLYGKLFVEFFADKILLEEVRKSTAIFADNICGQNFFERKSANLKELLRIIFADKILLKKVRKF